MSGIYSRLFVIKSIRCQERSEITERSLRVHNVQKQKSCPCSDSSREITARSLKVHNVRKQKSCPCSDSSREIDH